MEDKVDRSDLQILSRYCEYSIFVEIALFLETAISKGGRGIAWGRIVA